MTQFGRLSPDGYEVLGEVSQASMLACPFVIMEFEHYRPDGSCRCDDPVEQERLIREYDYTPEDFQKSPVETLSDDTCGCGGCCS